MVPPDPEPLEAAAAHHRAVADQLDDLYQQAISVNAQREDAAQSAGFEVGHQVEPGVCRRHQPRRVLAPGRRELFSGIGGVCRDVTAKHAEILTTAHQEIAAAKTGPERAAIIAMNNSMARTVAANGVEAVGGYDTYFHANYDTEYAVLSTRLFGGIADAPPPPAPGGGGIIVPVDHKHPIRDDTIGDDGKSGPDQARGHDAGSGLSGVPKAARGLGKTALRYRTPLCPARSCPLRCRGRSLRCRR